MVRSVWTMVVGWLGVPATAMAMAMTMAIPLAISGCDGGSAEPGVLARASHRWQKYHWARTANPFTLKLGNNLAPHPAGTASEPGPACDQACADEWNQMMWDATSSVSVDWNRSAVLDVAQAPPDPRDRIDYCCMGLPGTVELCNCNFGYTGFLGLASITTDGRSHITSGAAMLNDTYLHDGYSAECRRHVLCQEVGHTLGLDHDRRAVTCMNDTRCDVPSPGPHDYNELASIYRHLDGYSTVAARQAAGEASGLSAIAPFNPLDPDDLGTAIEDDGRSTLFVKPLDDGGERLTRVLWR